MTSTQDSKGNTQGHGWRLPLLLGVLVPFLAWGSYRLLYPPIDPATERAAHLKGYDPREYSMIFGLLDKTDLSESEWREVMTVFHDPNVKIRKEAVSVMMHMSHSPRRNQILAMVRPQLGSPDVDMEISALTLLWKFNDPSWRSEALKRQSRPEEGMRECVEDILNKGDVKQ